MFHTPNSSDLASGRRPEPNAVHGMPWNIADLPIDWRSGEPSSPSQIMSPKQIFLPCNGVVDGWEFKVYKDGKVFTPAWPQHSSACVR